MILEGVTLKPGMAFTYRGNFSQEFMGTTYFMMKDKDGDLLFSIKDSAHPQAIHPGNLIERKPLQDVI
ncbi:MAG: hypothetical protein IIC74_03590 [Bacteroidetes bacterium]|nr:hypothetical protein [Bacteroidota bacterium]